MSQFGSALFFIKSCSSISSGVGLDWGSLIKHVVTKSWHSADLSFPTVGIGWWIIKSSNSKMVKLGWSGGGKAGLFWATSIIVKPKDQMSDRTV